MCIHPYVCVCAVDDDFLLTLPLSLSLFSHYDAFLVLCYNRDMYLYIMMRYIVKI